MGQQHALVAKIKDPALVCENRSSPCKPREVFLLLHSALGRPPPESCKQFWGLPFKKDVGRIKIRQQHKWLEAWGAQFRRKELGVSSLEKRGLRGELITAFECLKRGYIGDGGRLASVASRGQGKEPWAEIAAGSI